MVKYTSNPPLSLEELSLLAKALSDEGRVRILLALRESELCVCQLTELLHLAPSTVSKHLTVLRHAGLIQTSKRGRWVYVRRAQLPDGSSRGRLMEWLDASLGESEPTVASDCCRLDAILKCDPSELSARQS
jgi:ArsR family transcriptional regulator, arsenate/arsenite/antimonite-responsive transcriptional repressor